MKLLIADDVRSFLELETTFLRRAACMVVATTTGLEALRLAQELRPDLIVLDIEMPEMNGIEVTRILKATPSLSTIPVIILSGVPRREEALAAGAQEFLSKPVDEDQFLAVVQRFVPLRVRQESRRTIEGPCTVQVNGAQWPAVAADVSASGLFLRMDRPPAVGEPVRVSFRIPRGGGWKELEAEGLVVRTAPGGCGVGFRDLPDGTRWVLQEYVAESA